MNDNFPKYENGDRVSLCLSRFSVTSQNFLKLKLIGDNLVIVNDKTFITGVVTSRFHDSTPEYRIDSLPGIWLKEDWLTAGTVKESLLSRFLNGGADEHEI